MNTLIEAADKMRAVQAIPPVCATMPKVSGVTFGSARQGIAPNGGGPMEALLALGELAITPWPSGPNRTAARSAASMVTNLTAPVGGFVRTKPFTSMEADIPGSRSQAAALALAVRPASTSPGPTVSRAEAADHLPSPAALRIATDAIGRGYDLTDTEATSNPAIVAQAMELSFLLEAYGLIPTKPASVAERVLPREPGSAGTISGLSGAGPECPDR